MSNIVSIKPGGYVAESLREIADRIDAGEFFDGAEATLVIGSNIYHFGCFGTDEAAVVNAAWNLQCAIHKIMNGAQAIYGD